MFDNQSKHQENVNDNHIMCALGRECWQGVLAENVDYDIATMSMTPTMTRCARLAENVANGDHTNDDILCSLGRECSQWQRH